MVSSSVRQASSIIITISSRFEVRTVLEPGKNVLNIRLRSYHAHCCQIGFYKYFQKWFFSKKSLLFLNLGLHGLKNILNQMFFINAFFETRAFCHMIQTHSKDWNSKKDGHCTESEEVSPVQVRHDNHRYDRLEHRSYRPKYLEGGPWNCDKTGQAAVNEGSCGVNIVRLSEWGKWTFRKIDT